MDWTTALMIMLNSWFRRYSSVLSIETLRLFFDDVIMANYPPPPLSSVVINEITPLPPPWWRNIWMTPLAAASRAHLLFGRWLCRAVASIRQRKRTEFNFRDRQSTVAGLHDGSLQRQQSRRWRRLTAGKGFENETLIADAGYENESEASTLWDDQHSECLLAPSDEKICTTKKCT